MTTTVSGRVETRRMEATRSCPCFFHLHSHAWLLTEKSQNQTLFDALDHDRTYKFPTPSAPRNLCFSLANTHTRQARVPLPHLSTF